MPCPGCSGKFSGFASPTASPFSHSTAFPELSFLQAVSEVPCPFCSTQCGGVCFALGSVSSSKSHSVRGMWAFASVISLLPSSELDPPFPVHREVGADLNLPSTHVGSMIHIHCNKRNFCCQDMKSLQHRAKPREINRWGSFSTCSLFLFSFS